MQTGVIFGGCGFVGLYFAEELIKLKTCEFIYLIDTKEPEDNFLITKFILLKQSEKVKFIKSDVRQSLNNLNIKNVDLIVDFAAVHREPGHKDYEYFETNVEGSKNICNFAESTFCKNIIFTSSIAVYGAGDYEKNETSKTLPTSAYGKSKLECEKNYTTWYNKNKDKKIVTICRPGVVFGPGEKGNVTRLIKIIKKRLFFYMGNKDLRKAGIYIKELVNILIWVNQNQLSKNFESKTLFNASLAPCPKLINFVQEISKKLNLSGNFLSFPKSLLIFFIFITAFITKNLKSSSNFSHVRLKKLFRSNSIKPNFLLDMKYSFKYDLSTSMEDWKKTNPSDWI
jgi:GlcNAc-P-P-Und epimerase